MSDTNTKRRRRILGLPVPVIAALLAVLMGGAAVAVVLFTARVEAQRKVRGTPEITWVTGTKVVAHDGASCEITSASGNKLGFTIDGYPGGTCDVAAAFQINGAGTYKLVGVDLGTKLEAELVAGSMGAVNYAPYPSTQRQSFYTVGETFTSGIVPIRLQVTIPADAEPGSASAATNVGIMVEPLFE